MNENKNVKRNYLLPTKYTHFFKGIMCMILVFAMPASVKCDMGDTIASMVLFMILLLFVCAGIGWWNRRQENK